MPTSSQHTFITYSNAHMLSTHLHNIFKCPHPLNAPLYYIQMPTCSQHTFIIYSNAHILSTHLYIIFKCPHALNTPLYYIQMPTCFQHTFIIYSNAHMHALSMSFIILYCSTCIYSTCMCPIVSYLFITNE